MTESVSPTAEKSGNLTVPIYEYLFQNRISGRGIVTITALARRLGVSRQAIHAWASGEYQPSDTMKEALRELGLRHI